VTSLPLHPAIVHLPLGLAFVTPLLAIGFAWAIWRGRLRNRAWISIVVLQAVLLGAGVVAVNTGSHEEDRVEHVVPESAIERHEMYAEQFVWATGFTLVIAGLVLVFRQPVVTHTLTLAAVAGTVIVAGAALRVGHAGGQLVYVHNAGAAYSSVAKSTGTATRSTESPESRRHGDSEDD
jgi:uncharacterized membrane protein